jgi:YVTN family beta-propeller protein
MRGYLSLIVAVICFASSVTTAIENTTDKYLSPTCMCFDNESDKIYVSLSTAEKIAVINTKNMQSERTISLPFNPGGIAFNGKSKTLIVADKKPEGRVHIISLLNGKIKQSFAVGHTPDALVITPDQERIFVANRFSNTVSVIDIINNRVVRHIAVERDPIAIAISDDGKYIAVANRIPNTAATTPLISAEITLIDCKSLEVINNFKLANGSQSIEGVVFSKDSKYLYASHVLSRNHLPTTQLKHGWMNTNALSILDIEAKKYFTTVLLDNFDLGAANPSGMDISEDGGHLYIALSGVHELCVIDLKQMHKKLESAKNKDFRNMASRDFNELPNDLRFLYDLKKRIPLKGKSPRHVCVSKSRVFVSSYFSAGLDYFADPWKSDESEVISLGNEPMMTSARRGELLFCDADLCFQKWQSCITCHPDARVDGINWDLLNDGTGNPKNTKSMLYSHFTPPVMITGIRATAEMAVRSGIKFIQFSNRPESEAQDIDDFLRNLKPVESPFLVKGELSEKGKKGKQIFEVADCQLCHSGKYFTDGNKYDVGTGITPIQNNNFDTPTLIEIWRTSPYLNDGRAKTMKEVFTKFNTEDKHGKTSDLTDKDLDNLIEYILSL